MLDTEVLLPLQHDTAERRGTIELCVFPHWPRLFSRRVSARNPRNSFKERRRPLKTKEPPLGNVKRTVNLMAM